MRSLVLIFLACLWSAQSFGDFDQAISDYHTDNFDSAFDGFMAAAISGDHVAQFNVGVMYYRGQGVAKSLVEAYSWIDLATEAGDVDMIRAQGYLVLEMTTNQLNQARKMASARAKEHGLAYVQRKPGRQSLAIVDR